MDYGVKDALLKSLVNVLKPPKKLAENSDLGEGVRFNS
jgi:hypothetical protein